jgi:hypothetical protein
MNEMVSINIGLRLYYVLFPLVIFNKTNKAEKQELINSLRTQLRIRQYESIQYKRIERIK